MTTSTATEYWQQKVSQKEISRFNMKNIPKDKQCLVLNAALKGQKSLYDQELKWKVTRTEGGHCELALLFYFDKELASRLGLIQINKVPGEQILEVRQAWMKHSVERYRDLSELNTALDLRMSDLNDLYEKAKGKMEDIQARNSRAFFVNLSKYTHLLNSKKRKIQALLGVEEEQKITVGSLKVEKKEPFESTPRKKSVRKSTLSSSLPLSFPKCDTQNEASSQVDTSSSLLSLPTQQHARSEEESDVDASSSDTDDDLLTQSFSNSGSQAQPYSIPRQGAADGLSQLNLPEQTEASSSSSVLKHPTEPDLPCEAASMGFDAMFFGSDDEESLLMTKTN
ncbi:hypothetical protein BY458DRAFT_327839 [Sporodiniella umbellata]|nr:hypothetical protein BY458DRAFT_327839 [Sporodiniella umbellata]